MVAVVVAVGHLLFALLLLEVMKEMGGCVGGIWLVLLLGGHLLLEVVGEVL